MKREVCVQVFVVHVFVAVVVVIVVVVVVEVVVVVFVVVAKRGVYHVQYKLSLLFEGPSSTAHHFGHLFRRRFPHDRLFHLRDSLRLCKTQNRKFRARKAFYPNFVTKTRSTEELDKRTADVRNRQRGRRREKW